MTDGDRLDGSEGRIVEELVPRDASGPGAADATSAVGRAPGHGRWVVAAVVVAVVGAATLGAGLLLTRPQPPEALAFVPADSGIVLEIRRDLPGDQRLRAGNLLAHFPGFKDQSNLEAKIDEALERVTRSLTNGKVDFVRDIRPWLGGPVLIAARTAADLDTDRWVLVATADQPVDCVHALQAPTRIVEHGGVRMTEDARGRLACAQDGRHALFGDAGRVADAIDARAGKGSLTNSSAYREAMAALAGDRIAAAYATGTEAAAMVGLLSPTAKSLVPLIGSPPWVAAALRAEDDAIRLDVVAPAAGPPSGPGSPGATGGNSGGPGATAPSRGPALASSLPASTEAEVEVHGAGSAVPGLIGLLRAMPATSSSIDALDRDLAALGGLAGLTDWVDDAAAGIVGDGPGASIGVILRGRDPAVAAEKVAQLRGIVALAALTGRLTTTETTIAGVAVTSVVVGDPAVSFSFAEHGGSAILGVGDAVIRTILEADPTRSLASDASFSRAIERAGGAGRAQVFVRAAPLAGAVRGALGAAEAWWTTEVRPYSDHLDAVAADLTMEGGRIGTRIVVTVE